jgi:hypothetical protein
MIMKQSYRNYVAALLIISCAVFLAHKRNVRKTETRFLRDYQLVAELAERMAAHAPQGFESSFSRPGQDRADFELMQSVARNSVHSTHDWWGDSFRQAIYKPAAARAGETNAPADAAALLKQYFGDLERSGFTSGQVGFGEQATTESTEVASKCWYNWDRTLIVQGQVVRSRASGEIIASVGYSATLNYRPR